MERLVRNMTQAYLAVSNSDSAALAPAVVGVGPVGGAVAWRFGGGGSNR